MIRTWGPIGLLALVAAGGLIAGLRSTSPQDAPPAQATVLPPAVPSEPPPLAALAARARELEWPIPPTIGKAAEKDIREYVEKVESLARGKDPETAALARDLARRIRKDAREWEQQKRRREFAERQKSLDAVREAHRKEAPAPAAKPPDPNRAPPPSPLLNPPVAGVGPPPEKK